MKQKSRHSKGDLVCCYIFNTTDGFKRLNTGVVVDMNEIVGDVLVVDQHGWSRWWPADRWTKCEEE